MSALLQIEHVTKEFSVSRTESFPAVDDVSLTLEAGETLSVVGESGCGKSTLARVIVRGIEATSGAVHYDPGASASPAARADREEGRAVDFLALKGRALRKHRPDIQMIFQDPMSSLDPRMTVFDIIAEPLRATSRPRKQELQRRVREIAEKVGLDPSHLRRYPHSFSGGQRQRIGIARALITDPKVIVADEAVSALDVSIRAQIINLLKDLQDELGLSYLFIAHDLSIVEYISDRVAVMYLGRIVELADTESLFSRPRHPYTEALLSAVPQPDPDAPRRRIVPKGEVPSPTDRPEGCLFSSRCHYATELCRTTTPALQEAADGHFSACHYADELPLRGIADQPAVTAAPEPEPTPASA
ncbi:ABC transporter ATP-binding protein [Brachybacterium sp. FME24]|uniref:ABC transporter ATP-binding protein n=1 Tax=Brachybacterium sp. FME24 TaxID=2742605 RepID=UPI00186886C9|nr:oligopeptide/dipeptide ABC transporter ATP-binding protein [Brachybacterium sp. FME24]